MSQVPQWVTAPSKAKRKPPLPVMSRKQIMSKAQLRKFMGKTPTQLAMTQPRGKW